MADVILTPRQAADALGVSGTALRRACKPYEALFGVLKTDERGGREFPPETVERLRIAFSAVHAGRVASLEMALRLLQEGDELPAQIEPPTPRAGDLEELARGVSMEIVAGLREDLQAVREENAALRKEAAEMRETLAGLIAVMQGQAADVRDLSGRFEHLAGIIAAQKVREYIGGPSLPTLPAPVDSDAVRVTVREEVRAALDPERLRVALHASTPESARPAPRRGWLARLLGL